MRLNDQPIFVLLVWAVLGITILMALWQFNLELAGVCAMALALSMAPALFSQRFDLRVPRSFTLLIVCFALGTLILGEVYDFYEKYWWWDILLHGGSALVLGMCGFVFVFYLFEGDRYAAPPMALAFIGFCFAVMVGAVWEIFEFVMDQSFGLNMQKSGLVDTMWDLIVDVIGATLGAGAGYLYLAAKLRVGPPGMIAEFVSENRRKLFRRARD